jgi:ATP-dependent DNA ligase
LPGEKSFGEEVDVDYDWVVKPMLAEPLDDPKRAAALVSEWYVEQKFDGVRCLVHCHDGKVIGINRKGSLMLLPDPVGQAFTSFDGEWVFDGELIKGVLWVFDLPRALEVVTPSRPYRQRREILEGLWPRLSLPPAHVKLAPSYRGDPKRAAEFVRGVHVAGGEGVMLKDPDAPYRPGQRTREVLKWKFWETVDCIVIEPWREGKQSMSVGVVDPATGEIMDVGSVKMTPANLEKVSTGDVVEVRYLYVDDLSEPRLYQPDFIRIRDDKSPAECVVGQLKQTNKEVVVDR